METLTINHDNGKAITYNLIEGEKDKLIAYHVQTNMEVVGVLERCRKERIRIKIDLGDVKTGVSWEEEYDVTGYVGLSRGHKAMFPILVYNKRSTGGGTILDHCIIGIYTSKGKECLYKM